MIASADTSLTTRLATLAAQANEAHGQVELAATTMLVSARDAGKALLAAKKAGVPHGSWQRWLNEHFKGSDRSARSYMQIAKHWKHLRKSENGSALPFSIREALDIIAHARGTPLSDGITPRRVEVAVAPVEAAVAPVEVAVAPVEVAVAPVEAATKKKPVVDALGQRQLAGAAPLPQCPPAVQHVRALLRIADENENADGLAAALAASVSAEDLTRLAAWLAELAQRQAAVSDPA